MRQDVQATTVRHPQNNLGRADAGRCLQGEIQHGDQHVRPLDREALLADVGPVEKLLQALDLGKPLLKPHPVTVSGRARVCPGLHLIPEPSDNVRVF